MGASFLFCRKNFGSDILKQKLELTWVGKNNPPNVEPRILLHKKNFDYGETDTENILIHGDNLLALKSLEQDFAGKIKCVYIDPPYNTGAAFEHYDDNLEHSIWLNFMAARLKILKNLLRDDGSIWISVDDDEQAYLKILCDEIFGRNNFVCNVIWEKKYTISNDAKYLSDNHDFILVYAKDKNIWRPNPLPRTEEMNKAYKNPDNDPRGVWKPTPLHARSGSLASAKFTYTFKNGVIFIPPPGRYARHSAEILRQLDESNEIWFGKDGKSTPQRKTFLSQLRKSGVPSKTLWRFEDVGHTHEAREEVKLLNPDNPFATPKPEKLIERILTLATNEGEIVLDSFLGSGTTAAVAHKMGRQWIGIELEKTCFTHCIPRLKKVIDGEQGGISKNVNWQGGGGFKFYELAPTLIVKDKFGMEIFNPQYDSEMLAAAVAKHNGFIFMPDENIFWKQGKSQENSFIYTTTNYLTTKYLDEIAREMRENENLLICAPAFDVGLNERYENISVKKIPQSLLKKCEYDVENYDLKISEGIDGDG